MMEAVLTRPENDTVEAYWKMLSTLSRTVKLCLASKLTKSVLDDEIAERSPLPSRKAKVIRRAVDTPSDAELESKFANQEMLKRQTTIPNGKISLKPILARPSNP
jgi:hypothetical protein